MKQPFTIGAFGLIRDENKRILLVLRNDMPVWNLPGGGMEKDEAPWQCVVREVKEETGFDVEVVRLVGIYSKPKHYDVVFTFECRISGGQITHNDEAADIQWFDFKDIPKNISPKHLERIEDLWKETPEVMMKIQTGKSTIERIEEGKL
jgi:8-oxo-dGTP diphosphatase